MEAEVSRQRLNAVWESRVSEGRLRAPVTRKRGLVPGNKEAVSGGEEDPAKGSLMRWCFRGTVTGLRPHVYTHNPGSLGQGTGAEDNTGS